ATVQEASFLLNAGSRNLFTPDVILISSDLQNYTDKYLIKLKEIALTMTIPFILYSPKFDSLSRNIAMEFGFDDYYAGNLSEGFIKKVEFVTKLKAYKTQRGNRPFELNHHHDQPQVKMWTLKRAFDILVSGSLLLLLSPLMILVALLVRLESKGPIFYISKRAGNGYKIFDFYKFRSMRQGAEAELKDLSHKNQ